jgi:hypothetical protein
LPAAPDRSVAITILAVTAQTRGYTLLDFGLRPIPPCIPAYAVGRIAAGLTATAPGDPG